MCRGHFIVLITLFFLHQRFPNISERGNVFRIKFSRRGRLREHHQEHETRTKNNTLYVALVDNQVKNTINNKRNKTESVKKYAEN